MSWQHDFLDRMNSAHVCVIGDVMLDRYLDGKINRISPEAPVPVLELNNVSSRLGGAANVALNLVRLGCRTALFGVVGADANAGLVGELLRARGIDGSGLMPAQDRPTTVKTRVIAEHHHVLRVDEESTAPLPDQEATRLINSIVRYLDQRKPDAIILQDYNKGVLTEQVIKAVIEAAAKAAIPIAVDPKDAHFYSYTGVDLFKPNLRELRSNVPFPVAVTTKDLLKASRYIMDRLGNRVNCFTLGEHGMFIDDGASSAIYPTIPRDVVDVCGAGDAVISALTLGRLSGLNAEELAALGNIAGGLVCEHVGVTALSDDMLRQEFGIARNV